MENKGLRSGALAGSLSGYRDRGFRYRQDGFLEPIDVAHDGQAREFGERGAHAAKEGLRRRARCSRRSLGAGELRELDDRVKEEDEVLEGLAGEGRCQRGRLPRRGARRSLFAGHRTTRTRRCGPRREHGPGPRGRGYSRGARTSREWPRGCRASEERGAPRWELSIEIGCSWGSLSSGGWGCGRLRRLTCGTSSERPSGTGLPAMKRRIAGKPVPSRRALEGGRG